MSRYDDTYELYFDRSLAEVICYQIFQRRGLGNLLTAQFSSDVVLSTTRSERIDTSVVSLHKT